jgi:hypothetical protein
MVVTRVSGGLGNQLFQYATGRRLAVRCGTELAVDISNRYENGRERQPGQELRQFAHPLRLFEFRVAGRIASVDDCLRVGHRFTQRRLSHRLVRLIWRTWPTLVPRTFFRERGSTFDPAVLDLPDNTYLDGLWQSEKYFSDVREVIRSDLQPRDNGVLGYAGEYVAQLRKKARYVVALHVRRGDLAYATEVLGNERLVHGQPVSLDYIYASMRRFDGDAAFLVFSDSEADLDWCRRNIRGANLFFAEGHSDVQDFVLMSRCDHNIIANSTFSWWAAWLNPNAAKRTIAPRVWAGPWRASALDTRDLLPAAWEVL